MFRLHKRKLKSVRLLKKKNSTKEKIECGGTGLKFMSYSDFLSNQKYLSFTKNKTNWNERHQNQIMESPVHDRTKWKSSKLKDKIRRR